MLKNFIEHYSSTMMRINRVKYENKSDLENEDYVEVHSEDLDTEQDISSEESELVKNEEYFGGKR